MSRKENEKVRNDRESVVAKVGVTIILILVVSVISGCSYQRDTEGGALAKFGFQAEILPSNGSGDYFYWTNKAVETGAKYGDPTNTHTAGIRKAQINANVTSTSYYGVKGQVSEPLGSNPHGGYNAIKQESDDLFYGKNQ